jgi:membrane protease YdiL (CAAX protease family)
MNQSAKRHPWKRLPLLIIPYFFIVGLFQFVGASISGADLTNFGAEETDEQHLMISLFGLVGTFLVIYLFMKFVDKEPFLNLGFKFRNHEKDIMIGVLVGLFIMGSGYAILVFFEQLKFVSSTFFFQKFLMALVVYLCVAFAEETLFRGYILRNLMLSTQKNLALIISAIIFAAMHAFNPNITYLGYLNLFLAGILLGLPYLYTNNLWFPISLHFSWNFFQSLFGFNVSGLNSYSIVNFNLIEKNNFNGGDFGFEGSVVSIAAQLIFILLAVYYFNRNSTEHKKSSLK